MVHNHGPITFPRPTVSPSHNLVMSHVTLFLCVRGDMEALGRRARPRAQTHTQKPKKAFLLWPCTQRWLTSYFKKKRLEYFLLMQLLQSHVSCEICITSESRINLGQPGMCICLQSCQLWAFSRVKGALSANKAGHPWAAGINWQSETNMRWAQLQNGVVNEVPSYPVKGWFNSI